MVEMDEFRADAAEVIPDTTEHFFNFFRRPIRKSVLQVFPPNAVFPKPRSDVAQKLAGCVRGPDRVGPPQSLKQQQGEGANGEIKRRLDTAGEAQRSQSQ